MTLEKNSKRGEVKPDSQITFLVVLNMIILAVICACANSASATYFAIYFCQEPKNDAIMSLASRYAAIGQIAVFMNCVCAFVAGFYVQAIKRLKPMILAPLLGFFLCCILAQRILSLANQCYGFQRMLQIETAIVSVCMTFMLLVLFGLITQSIKVANLCKSCQSN